MRGRPRLVPVELTDNKIDGGRANQFAVLIHPGPLAELAPTITAR